MVRVNLLPIREILRKRELKQFGLLAGAIIGATVAVMVLGYFALTMKISDLESDKAAQQKTLEELKRKNQEINQLREEIARLQKQVDTIEKLTKVRDTPADFMVAVSTAIPEEVWVQTVTKKGKGFTIDGMGPDNTVIVSFVRRLSAIRKDFTAKRPWIDPSEKEAESFFSDVKLVEVVKGGAAGAGVRGAMKFKIVGSIR